MAEKPFEAFKDWLEEEGYRLTRERELVARAVFEREDYFEAEAVLFDMRRQGGDVSRATIYRTLELLIESGQLQKVDFRDGYSLYEVQGTSPDHGHLYCERCGKVIEFDTEAIRERERAICERHGFAPEEYRNQIYGYCEDCRSDRSSP